MQVDIATKPALNIATPKILFSVSSTGRRLSNGFDVFPDGKRLAWIAQVQSDQPQPTPAITVVQNWFAEFRDRHAAGR